VGHIIHANMQHSAEGEEQTRIGGQHCYRDREQRGEAEVGRGERMEAGRGLMGAGPLDGPGGVREQHVARGGDSGELEGSQGRSMEGVCIKRTRRI
jgi:hypothetical protein